MTNIVMATIRGDDGTSFYSIQAEGHAKGSVEACAGVSAILYALAGWLHNAPAAETEIHMMGLAPACVMITYKSTSDVAHGVFDATAIGLLQLEKAYPKQVRVAYVEGEIPGGDAKWMSYPSPNAPFELDDVNLKLFDGEGGASGGDAGGSGDTAAKGDAGGVEGKATAEKGPRNNAAAADTQTVSNADPDPGMLRELQALRNQAKAVAPLLRVLAGRYGGETDPGKLAAALDGDSTFWADAAENAGMTVEQYKHMMQLEGEHAARVASQRRAAEQARINAQLQRWYAEGQAVKAKYPEFDLNEESRSPEFRSLLRRGVPVEHAYKVLHLDQLMTSSVTTAVPSIDMEAVDMSKPDVQEAVSVFGELMATKEGRAQLARQAVSGVKPTKVSGKDSRADRARLAKRSLRGEKISL